MVGEPAVRRWSPILSLGRGDVRACVFGGKRTLFFLCFTTCLMGSIRAQRIPALLSLAFGRGPSNRQWRQNCCARTRAHTHTHTHALCPCRAHPPNKSKSIVNDQHKCARASQTMRAHAHAQPIGDIIVVVIIVIVVVFRRSCVRVWVQPRHNEVSSQATMRVSEVDGNGSETAEQKYFFKTMTHKILDRDDDDDDIGRILLENFEGCGPGAG